LTVVAAGATGAAVVVTEPFKGAALPVGAPTLGFEGAAEPTVGFVVESGVDVMCDVFFKP
jgi:hypothetical protein